MDSGGFCHENPPLEPPPPFVKLHEFAQCHGKCSSGLPELGIRHQSEIYFQWQLLVERITKDLLLARPTFTGTTLTDTSVRPPSKEKRRIFPTIDKHSGGGGRVECCCAVSRVVDGGHLRISGFPSKPDV